MNELITINFNISQNGSRACHKYGCMWERDLLDNFAKRWYKKLDICPKRISGNFIILNNWINNTKQFNKNKRELRTEFWDNLKNVCKRNKISYTTMVKKI